MKQTNKHTPLFLKQIVNLLKNRSVIKIIDATFGEGGHGLSLAKFGYQVLGIEADDQMFKLAETNIIQAGLSNVRVVKGNYRNLKAICTKEQFDSIDAIIFDLGLSMFQLENSSKGFSFQRPAKLDLRIDLGFQKTAADFLNHAKQEELIDQITRLVEDKQSLVLCRSLLKAREKRSITEIVDLVEIINDFCPVKKQANQLLRQLLQALRIIVNDEFTAIKQGMMAAISVLKPKGLLIMLTYHSLEDRLVKRLGRQWQDQLTEVQKVISNKDYQFARSGKLRVYEKQIC